MKRCLPALLMTLAVAAAGADEYHHQNFLLGERAMAIGGAYTALGASPISAWYNPAGIAFLKGTRFSMQTGVYGSLGDATDGGGGFLPADNGRFLAFASTAAFVRQVGGPKHRVGAVILTPDFDSRSVRLAARNVTVPGNAGPVTLTSVSLVQNVDDISLWVGPAYAYQIHPRVSLGANLLFAWRTRNQTTKFEGRQAGVIIDSSQVDVSMSHLSLLATVGVRAEIVEGLFVGASFRTPNLRLRGGADVSVLFINPGGDPRATLSGASSHSQLPWRLALGLAYTRPKSFSVAADVTIHGGTDPYSAIESPDLEPQLSEIAKERVVNVNVGVEYYITRAIPLRLGFFTNYSAQATPRPEVPVLLGLSGVVGGEGRVPNLFGITGGFAFEGESTTLSLAVNYLFGSGNTMLGDAQGGRAVRRLLFGIGGSYAF